MNPRDQVWFVRHPSPLGKVTGAEMLGSKHLKSLTLLAFFLSRTSLLLNSKNHLVCYLLCPKKVWVKSWGIGSWKRMYFSSFSMRSFHQEKKWSEKVTGEGTTGGGLLKALSIKCGSSLSYYKSESYTWNSFSLSLSSLS